jgi:hypothetical protein
MSMRKNFYILLGLLILLSLTFYSAFSTPTKAAGIVGTGTPESCTEDALKGALASGGDINFFCGQSVTTIVLSDVLRIGQNTTLNGGGLVTISGRNVTRVFQVAKDVTLNLTQIVVAYGAANDPIDGSSRDGSGGGILNEGGTVNLIDSTVYASRADHNGGGIYNRGGTVTLLRSTISGNTVGDNGGGIINEKGTLTITNSTISENFAADNGGAIFNFGGTVTITNGTLANNNAAFNGSGVLNAQEGTVTIRNTIVSNNPALGSPVTGNCAGGVVDGGKNLQFPDKSCGESITVVDPVLGTLADNGGFAQTHALLDGSPAIDQADSGVCNSDPVNKVDERTVARPIGSNCDIGAYEYDPTKPGKGSNTNTDGGSIVEVCPTPTVPGRPTLIPCAKGTTWNARTRKCEKIQTSCPQGTILNPSTGRCDKQQGCGANQVLVNGQCMPVLACAPVAPFNPNTGQCDQSYGCSGGQLHNNAGTCVCPDGYSMQGDRCQPVCGANQHSSNGQCVCNDGYYLGQQGTCVLGKP